MLWNDRPKCEEKEETRKEETCWQHAEPGNTCGLNRTFPPINNRPIRKWRHGHLSSLVLLYFTVAQLWSWMDNQKAVRLPTVWFAGFWHPKDKTFQNLHGYKNCSKSGFIWHRGSPCWRKEVNVTQKTKNIIRKNGNCPFLNYLQHRPEPPRGNSLCQSTHLVFSSWI